MTRLLSLDYSPLFGDEEDLASSFGSDASCFDFDVVLWDPASSFEKYAQYAETHQGLPALSDSQSAQIMADVIRRKAEFKEFLKSGRTLIVAVRPAQACYVATGEVRTSGTGRNAAKTRMVEAFDIHAALPITDPKFMRAAGNRIELVGDGPVQTVLRANATHLKYAATMKEPPGTVLARVKGTTQAVGAVVRVAGEGLLLLIPHATFTSDRDEEDEEIWSDEASLFQTDLIESLRALAGNADVGRPPWAERFATPQVLAARAAVAKQAATVARARSKLSKVQETEERAVILDQLYLGTGRQLELRVADVMKILGGQVFEPEPGRADWHVDFGGTRAILEVKGVTKSAAEKNAAQLEKWVAGEIETTGTSPKGILVINTWRETPLDQRTQADFPEQMLPYSEARGHCLITGLELFVIAQAILADTDQKEFWRDKILSTAGRLAGVPEWRDVLQETTTTQVSPDTSEAS